VELAHQIGFASYIGIVQQKKTNLFELSANQKCGCCLNSVFYGSTVRRRRRRRRSDEDHEEQDAADHG
jgi:hypothetical protein